MKYIRLQDCITTFRRGAGADSINNLPIEECVKAIGMSRDYLCLGCVTGDYPTKMANKLSYGTKTSIKMGKEENKRIYE